MPGRPRGSLACIRILKSALGIVEALLQIIQFAELEIAHHSTGGTFSAPLFNSSRALSGARACSSNPRGSVSAVAVILVWSVLITSSADSTACGFSPRANCSLPSASRGREVAAVQFSGLPELNARLVQARRIAAVMYARPRLDAAVGLPGIFETRGSSSLMMVLTWPCPESRAVAWHASRSLPGPSDRP